MKALLLAMTAMLAAETMHADPGTKSDRATIHIYRNKALPGMLWKFKMRVNDEKLKVKNGGTYEISVPPGNTEVKIVGVTPRKLMLQAEPGKHYYVKSFLAASVFGFKAELAEVSERFGEQQINEINERKR